MINITNDNNNPLNCPKMNGNLTITENNQQEMMLYLNQPHNSILHLQGQYCSPRSYQDQNPDDESNEVRFLELVGDLLEIA